MKYKKNVKNLNEKNKQKQKAVTLTKVYTYC